VKLAAGIILLIALSILAFSAAVFETTTVIFIGAAMSLVAFFSGAAVVLGVFTRRAHEKTRRGTRRDTSIVVPDSDLAGDDGDSSD
jgi:hypothetical protein